MLQLIKCPGDVLCKGRDEWTGAFGALPVAGVLRVDPAREERSDLRGFGLDDREGFVLCTSKAEIAPAAV